MSESKLEADCRSWAKLRDWLVYKLTSPGSWGFPDRMFVLAGRIVFVEFKRPGGSGRLSRHQVRRIAELRGEGVEVYVVDDFLAFVEIMDPTASDL